MRILVTGGAGFIGSCFVRKALERGFAVTVLDALTYAGHLENLETSNGLLDGVDFVEGNIADATLLEKLFSQNSFQYVVNFAAESHVDRSISGPAAFIETNIGGTFQLLEQSLRYFKRTNPSHFRFLQISTDEVYGELGETGKFSETWAYRPNSPYSASKASADHLVHAWQRTFGLPTLITNCSNNYGPRQLPEKLIPVVITRALKEESIPVYGEGKNIRDWIHVEDHSEGIWLALEKGKPGETYCLGGHAEKRNIDLVETICSILDKLRPRSAGKKYRELISFVKDRPGHDWRYAIDDTKAERDLGFKRKYDFQTGIQATIEWYLANEAWCSKVRTKGNV